jgi:hypothetical membrane protein
MKNLLDTIDHHGVVWIAGLAGVGLDSLGALISAAAYHGRLGEPYSPLNHFVSELGELNVSPMAVAFNAGLLLGGLCLTVFLIGLGRRIGGWAGALFSVGGTACGISGALVGVYPMNYLGPHITWAMRFFNLGLLMMAVFSVMALAKIGGLSRWLAMPGGLSAFAFAAFLYLPKVEPGTSISPNLNPLSMMTSALSQPRPAVWSLAVLEWASVLSVLAWALWVALAMLRESRKVVKTTGAG